VVVDGAEAAPFGAGAPGPAGAAGVPEADRVEDCPCPEVEVTVRAWPGMAPATALVSQAAAPAAPRVTTAVTWRIRP
jgi:hypothetical protein